MKKLLSLLSLLLIPLLCLTPGQAEAVFGKITPTSPNATYPVTDTRYLLGGTMNWMTNVSQLTDTTAATGLPVARRVVGMKSIIGNTVWELGSDLTTWHSASPIIPFATMAALVASDPREYPTNTVFQTMGNDSPFDAASTSWVWNPIATDSTNYSIVQVAGVTTGRLIRRVELSTPTTTANSLYLVGDSITHGAAVGAGNPNSRWGSIVGLTNGWSTHNLAYGGARFADYLWMTFPGYTYTNVDYTPTEIASSPSAVTEDMVFAALMGYNDMRDFTPSTDYLTHMRRSLSAYIAWTGLPDSNKKMAQAANTVSGTWTDITYFGGTMGKKSSTPGDFLTFTEISGDSIYVCVDAFTASASNRTFSVLIDTTGFTGNVCGPAYGNRFHDGGNVFQPTYIGPAGDGDIDRVPWVFRFDGLSRTAHTVKVTVTGATDGPVEVLWVAGNGVVKNPRKGPYTLIGNTIRSSAAGYGVGSDSAAGGFARQMRQVCQWFQRDGLNVLYVDCNSYFNPNTMMSGDNVHPTDAGHFQISRAFQAALAPDLPQISATKQSGEAIFSVDGDKITMLIPGTTGQYARKWTWHGGSFPFFNFDMGAPLIDGIMWEIDATPASTTGLQYVQKVNINDSQSGSGRFVGLNMAITENNPTEAGPGPSYPILITNSRSNFVANLLKITSSGDYTFEAFATNSGRTATFQAQDSGNGTTNNQGSGNIVLHFGTTVTNSSIRNLQLFPNSIYTIDGSSVASTLSLGSGAKIVFPFTKNTNSLVWGSTASGPNMTLEGNQIIQVDADPTTYSIGGALGSLAFNTNAATAGEALWVKLNATNALGWTGVKAIAYSGSGSDITTGTVPAANLPDNALASSYDLMLADLSSTAKAHTVGINALEVTTALALASGTERVVPLWVPKTLALVTGVKFFLGVPGTNLTADATNGIALYSHSGTVANQIAITANDSVIWTNSAAGTRVQVAFVTPITNLVAGTYFANLLYHASAATTAPSLGAGPTALYSGPSGAIDNGSTRYIGHLSTQSTLPASYSLTGLSTSAGTIYVELY